MSMKYGAIIRKMREEKGMSLEECADRCMLIPGDLILVEEGKMELSEADLIITANVLGISSVALAEGELIRKEELPRLEDLIIRIDQKIQELEENMSYMQTIVEEFAENCGVIVDLDVIEKKLLDNIENPYEKEKGTVVDEREEAVGMETDNAASKDVTPELEAGPRL